VNGLEKSKANVCRVLLIDWDFLGAVSVLVSFDTWDRADGRVFAFMSLLGLICVFSAWGDDHGEIIYIR